MKTAAERAAEICEGGMSWQDVEMRIAAAITEAEERGRRECSRRFSALATPAETKKETP